MDSVHWLLIAILILNVVLLSSGNHSAMAARLRIVEDKLDAIMSKLDIKMDSSAIDQQIQELLRSGQKIAAIKIYRAHSGAGLKEAKDYVEEFER